MNWEKYEIEDGEEEFGAIYARRIEGKTQVISELPRGMHLTMKKVSPEKNNQLEEFLNSGKEIILLDE